MRPEGHSVPAWKVLLLGLVLGAAGACRQDMHDQPSYTSFEASSFFEDGSSARLPVPGTIARGQLRAENELLYTGVANGEPAVAFPFPIDETVITRGEDMYNAYCSPCHGRTGLGDGAVVQRGFTTPPDLTDSFTADLPLGYVFNVITNGFGAMPDHAAQIQVNDRWAIIAYLRRLQTAAAPPVATGGAPQG